MNIEWTEQNIYYGLDYMSKKGVWEDWVFDIRYDYDGNPKIKPEKSNAILTIIRNKNAVYETSGRNISELTEKSIEYMKKEQEKFLKAKFELI